MKLDKVSSVRELRQLADVGVALAIGFLAGVAFDISQWITLSAALLVIRPLEQKPEGSLWKKPTVSLAMLALCFIWLLSEWSAYRDGVFAGYDAAQSFVTH